MNRGFHTVAKYVKKFLEMHGYEVHLGAWVDIKIGGRLVFDFQIGHWAFFKPPKRGVPSALYVVSEGRIPRYAREWLKGYDYLFAPTKFVGRLLEELNLSYILMPHGIDINLFKPMNLPKFIDVLSVGIYESDFDRRKFMDKVHEVAYPHTCYTHTKPNLPYEELPKLYNYAKLYVSLSCCEAFNIPVVEANACGLPVIYNKSCGTEEVAFGIPVNPLMLKEVVIDGIPYSCYIPDIPKFRYEVHKLLNNPNRLKLMSLKARQHASRFDFRKTYRPLLEVLPKP